MYMLGPLGDEILHSVRDSDGRTSCSESHYSPVFHWWGQILRIFPSKTTGSVTSKGKTTRGMLLLPVRWLTFVTRRWNVW